MASYSVFLSPAGFASVTLRLDVWEHSQDVVNNRTTLGYNMYLRRENTGGTSSYDATNTSTKGLTINGTALISGTTNWDFRSSSGQGAIGATVGLGSGYLTVDHEPDGSKSVVISASFFDGGTVTIGHGSLSETLTLTTIPRASNITFSSNPAEAGSTVTINTNRASAGFTHDITYAMGSASGTIGTGVGASTTWAIPVSLLEQIPNNVSGAVNITTVTKSGATIIGSKVVSLTVTAGASVVPDIGSVSHSEATTTPDVATIVGAYVRSISSLSASLSGAVGAYGSTITSSKIELLSGASVLHTVNSSSGAIPLTTSGSLTLRGTVTDSRGRTFSKSVPVSVLSYSLPVIASYTMSRSTVGGTLDPDGTYMKVHFQAAVQSLVVGTQKNSLAWRIKARDRDDTTPWASAPVAASGVGVGTGFNDDVIIGTFPVTQSFEVRIEVSDALSQESFVLGVLATGGVPVHLPKDMDGLSVGAYHTGTGAALQVTGGADVDVLTQAGDPVVSVRDSELADSMAPVWSAAESRWKMGMTGATLVVGEAVFWPGTSNPPGFYIPFGTTLVNGLHTHSALAAAHPEWVVGNDIVTPDYGGHTMVHHKPGDSTFGTKGAKVGSKTHTLTNAEIPTGFVYDSGASGAYYFNYPAGSGRAQPGGGQPHNIVQPSAVGVWCVVAASTVGEYDPVVQAALVAQVADLNTRASVGVIPSLIAVDGSGATSTLQPDGRVDFTNATAISLRNVFELREGYEIIFSFTNAVAASQIRYGYMNPAGTAYASYDYVGILSNLGSGPSRSNGIGTADLHVSGGTIAAGTKFKGKVDFLTPESTGDWASTSLHSAYVGGGDRTIWDQEGWFAGDPRSILFYATAGRFGGFIKVIRKG